MDALIGVAIAIAILAFIVWLIGKIVSIVLFVAIVLPIYILLTAYAGVKFIAMNIFIGLDKLFYFGFDVPVIAVWIFWGLVIGAAIQGCREMKIYGRKWMGVLIAIAPVLLRVLVGGIRSLTALRVDTKVDPKPETSHVSGPEGMVLIPAGEFEMGSGTGDPDENPVHTVYLDAFYMDKYEVTNAEFAAFLNRKDRTPIVEKYSSTYYSSWYYESNVQKRIKYIDGQFLVQPGYENHPIRDVGWQAAMAYAVWAGKRLPTEAEWEKAARGGLVGKTYPSGDTISAHAANYAENIGDTTAVGSYPANGYGLYDMAGNVAEWCLDEYDAEFYANSPYKNPISGRPIAAVVNDFTEQREKQSISRGGSYSDNPSTARCADRNEGSFISGFRCVKTVSSTIDSN